MFFVYKVNPKLFADSFISCGIHEVALFGNFDFAKPSSVSVFVDSVRSVFKLAVYSDNFTRNRAHDFSNGFERFEFAKFFACFNFSANFREVYENDFAESGSPRLRIENSLHRFIIHGSPRIIGTQRRRS